MFKVNNYPLKPKLPDIRDTGNTVIVVLFSPEEELLKGIEYMDQSERGLDKLEFLEHLSERQSLAMKYIIKIKKITSRDYMEINKVSERTARDDIRDLVNKGLLKKVGTTQATYYIIRQHSANEI